MKLAVTMIPETNRISPVFETAEHLLTIRLCRSGNFSVISRAALPESESEKILFLRSSGVRILVCGAICNETLEDLRSIGVQVLPFASGTWESLVPAILDRSHCLPPEHIMPGCCGHHRKCCQHQGERTNENRTDKSR